MPRRMNILNGTMHDRMNPARQMSVPSIFDLPSAERAGRVVGSHWVAPSGCVASGPPIVGGRCQDCRVQGCEDSCNRPSQLFGSGTCQTLVRVNGPPSDDTECRSFEARLTTKCRSNFVSNPRVLATAKCDLHFRWVALVKAVGCIGTTYFVIQMNFPTMSQVVQTKLCHIHPWSP